MPASPIPRSKLALPTWALRLLPLQCRRRLRVPRLMRSWNACVRGTSLDALERSVLVGLPVEFDEESRNLLAAYLDRRHPRWREDVDDGATAGRRGPKMSEEEAYQILGLQPGASADETGRAHRGLMKRLHPDQGGRRILLPAPMRRRLCCFDAIGNSYARRQCALGRGGSRVSILNPRRSVFPVATSGNRRLAFGIG